jgi:hypothetical protein
MLERLIQGIRFIKKTKRNEEQLPEEIFRSVADAALAGYLPRRSWRYCSTKVLIMVEENM